MTCQVFATVTTRAEIEALPPGAIAVYANSAEVGSPVVPGQQIEYLVPDIFGRPWAEIWERYHEEGMQRPRQATGRFGL